MIGIDIGQIQVFVGSAQDAEVVKSQIEHAMSKMRARYGIKEESVEGLRSLAEVKELHEYKKAMWQAEQGERNTIPYAPTWYNPGVEYILPILEDYIRLKEKCSP